MYARKRLDIDAGDLAFGLGASLFSRDREALARRVSDRFAPRWSRNGGALVSLSVRSGFDLYLRALDLPPGSEVLISALTIPDMPRILVEHGLVPVPLDVDPRTLAPDLDQARELATERTRAVLLAHLFGGRFEAGDWVRLARERGWLLWEDLAQAFTGFEVSEGRGGGLGTTGADLVMFSFGTIKTATALGGGVLGLRDGELLGRMNELHGRWPVQPRREFLAKLLRVTGLALLSTPPLYWTFAQVCRRGGFDLDEIVQRSVRGFAGGDFFKKIRRRPSTPLLALLARRLERFDPVGIAERGAVGEELLERLPPALLLPGCDAPHRSHWVVSVLSDAPELLAAELFRRGFDATRRATLDVVPAPQDRPWARPRRAEELLEHLVYLPIYPQAPFSARARLAATLASHVEKSRSALPAT